MSELAIAVREVLASAFPELDVGTIEPLGEGWDHVAYLVNGDLVFRLPWELVDGDEPAPTHAAAEVALLRAVAKRLPVSVPEPRFVAADGTFFGYRHLPGDAVLDGIGAWDGARRSALVDRIADVVVAIERAVSPPEGRRMGLEWRDRSPHDLARVRDTLPRELVSPRMRAVAAQVMDTVEERWLAASRRRMAVLHADLGLDHWLVDAHGEVHALIDWSDACVAPPEHQLATLMWDVPALLEPAIDAYAARTGDTPDPHLVFADGYLNALEDLGELLDEQRPRNDPDLERTVRFLEAWSSGPQS